MMDKIPNTASGKRQPPGGSQKNSGNAEEELQEADVKRSVATEKINLKTFAALDSASQWNTLTSLIRDGHGPLRLSKEAVDGERVLYLRPRTWGQYFYETLVLFPAEQEARCSKVRSAIQTHIRPYLDAQTVMTVARPCSTEIRTFTILNRERMDILDRLDCRIYTNRIDPASFYGNKPRHVPDKTSGSHRFSQDVRQAYHGKTTVPKGLSIARIAPFKVTADVRILTEATHILAAKLPDSGENSSSPAQWTCPEMEQQVKTVALGNYYMGMLEAYGSGKRTIVLEAGGDSDEHWRSAYDAATRWLAQQPANDRPSIMLVPLYRINDFVPPGHDKAHHQGWTALMAKKLKMKDAEGPNQLCYSPASSGSSNAGGSVFRQDRPYSDNDNDNDNDNRRYTAVR